MTMTEPTTAISYMVKTSCLDSSEVALQVAGLEGQDATQQKQATLVDELGDEEGVRFVGANDPLRRVRLGILDDLRFALLGSTTEKYGQNDDRCTATMGRQRRGPPSCALFSRARRSFPPPTSFIVRYVSTEQRGRTSGANVPRGTPTSSAGIAEPNRRFGPRKLRADGVPSGRTPQQEGAGEAPIGHDDRRAHATHS